MLKIDNVTMRFGGVIAVNNFTADIKDGEIVGLIGPNGAGKTTVFNVVTGVYKPTEGQVIFNPGGSEGIISDLRPDQIAKLGICRTFQNIRLFKELSVLDNVFIGNHLRLKSGIFSSVLRLPNYNREERKMMEKAKYLLQKVGLYEEKEEKAFSLPYGKQRRLEIARALATDPKLLLLDEPAAGMNPQETQELMEFIGDIKNEFDLTIFLIEHHMEVVMGICEKIFVLDHGISIAEGNPGEIQNNSRVIEAYLGVE
ncbi:ABC transporter ATP-binding protein [Tissierella carlieri]|jgi:branched-chain amino acid transport system ATP-binding protein|uniref:ABC transporter ATP-binding protein n=1 Tax=Tissierella TaxID=41273 RepID=UPI000B9FA823|nr:MULTISPECIES: ABC transporter ATP-binding protein [Tissierella]MBU5312361.1 ABC transporter ATP-binding protein [Tissierella carlieri]OZV13354.1 high-affinity branched-chain amino acid ABC transporter ATP-binding protein LivG [Tissierella sp. P1]